MTHVFFSKTIFFTALLLLVKSSGYSDISVAIKEAARIKNIRSNQLVGYGLVVGLKGTGDTSRFPLTKEMMQNIIGNMGQSVDLSLGRSRNSAAVIVTAELPELAKAGDRINLQVASIGDAQSLQGGLLVQTPLMASDSKIYGYGQGIIIQSHDQTNANAHRGANIGLVAAGGFVEIDLQPQFLYRDQEDENIRYMVLLLNRVNFMVAKRIAEKISASFPDVTAAALDGSQVQVRFKQNNVTSLVATIMELRIDIPDLARVVIDEKSGVIVMGNNVKISPVAVSIDGLWQKNEGMGENIDPLEELYPRIASRRGQRGKALFYVEQITTVDQMVEKLNGMEISTRELIAVFKAIDESGALHGELIIRRY